MTEALAALVRAWLAEATDPATPPPDIVDPLLLTSWQPVAEAIAASASEDRRPALYAPTGDPPRPLRGRPLISDTGLLALIADRRGGGHADLDEAASQFAEFLTMEQPPVEQWLLVDADIAPGTDVAFGPWRLQVPGPETLKLLAPLPSAHELLADRRRIDAHLFGASAFLIREVPDGKPIRGLQLFLASRPEQLVWEPLLVLALWQPASVRLDAQYHVEPGRRVDSSWSQPSLDLRSFDPDDDPEEHHHHGPWELAQVDAAAFESFAETVHGLLASVLVRENSNNKAQKKTARRLRRAGQHLVRAAQRAWPDGTVGSEDRDEVLLHYVIAIEALLADDDHLDLSRKVAYRGAALHLTGTERVRVRRLLTSAYDARSKYAHGDETTADDIDLDGLRQAALTIYLRWLVLHTQAGERGLPVLLDTSVLDDDVRNRQVHAPLLGFHAATPPARQPDDLRTAMERGPTTGDA